MKTTLLVAWRNIWRNQRRSSITIAAIALNTAILIASFALTEGMLRQLTRNVTDIAAGHAQIHAQGYLAERSIYRTIDNPGPILAAARKAGIDAVARAYGFGLVSAGTKSAGAAFWGVDPAAEERTFRLPGRIQDGTFSSDDSPGGVVVGRKLAHALQIGVGDELVAVVQAADGSLGNELFTVVGILKAAGEDVDRSAVILRGSDFARLFLTGSRVHEIALNTRGAMPLDAIGPSLGDAIGGLELKTWRELSPAMAHMMDVSSTYMWILALVFYLAAALGVMNTMLMATHDRVREYGVLKALGATPLRIIADVAAEGWMISLCSTVAGALLGIAASSYFQTTGIDLGANAEMDVAGIPYDTVWYAALVAKDFLVCVVTMWAVCVLASLYPAVKAARLDAVEAMTHV